MRKVFYLAGVAGLGLAVWGFITAATWKPDFWSNFLGGVAFAVAGAALLVGGKKKYRGHLLFIIGVALLALGILGLGAGIDDYLANSSAGQRSAAFLRSPDFLNDLFLVTLFSTGGVLLLLYGHKLHTSRVASDGQKQNAE